MQTTIRDGCRLLDPWHRSRTERSRSNLLMVGCDTGVSLPCTRAIATCLPLNYPEIVEERIRQRNKISAQDDSVLPELLM